MKYLVSEPTPKSVQIAFLREWIETAGDSFDRRLSKKILVYSVKIRFGVSSSEKLLLKWAKIRLGVSLSEKILSERLKIRFGASLSEKIVLKWLEIRLGVTLSEKILSKWLKIRLALSPSDLSKKSSRTEVKNSVFPLLISAFCLVQK